MLPSLSKGMQMKVKAELQNRVWLAESCMPIIKPLMFYWQGFPVKYSATMKKLEKYQEELLHSILGIPVSAHWASIRTTKPIEWLL
ncbi:MAG: hypothetical protein ACTS73_06140 [Arsenophonus sp. NEOnobi-MAG3]